MNTSVKEKQLSLKTPSIKIDDKGFTALSKRELSSLKKRISSLLEELPGDTLIISKSNGCTQYYRYSKAHRSRKIFIPGDSIEYAKQLATREYLEMLSAEIVCMNPTDSFRGKV